MKLGYYYYYYRQDLPQAALPVFRLLTGRFWGFSPRFWAGGLRPPKLKKIEIYQYNCP